MSDGMNQEDSQTRKGMVAGENIKLQYIMIEKKTLDDIGEPEEERWMVKMHKRESTFRVGEANCPEIRSIPNSEATFSYLRRNGYNSHYFPSWENSLSQRVFRYRRILARKPILSTKA